jgi:chitodextrinase
MEHVPWLTWNSTYSSSSRKQFYAKFTDTVDKDSVITIPVDAIDDYGFSATRTFDITIKPRVYKPVVKNPIADTSVAVNSSNIQIPLADVFTNTSSSGVTFGKAISGNTNSELITTAISNDTLILSLTSNKAGEALITVKDSAMHSSYGVKYVETSFKVTVVDNEEPSIPENLMGVPSENSVALSWTASADNVGVVGYVIYLDGDSINTVTETTFAATELDVLTEYTFEVEAFDASGNKSEKASITVSTTDETAPSVPADLAATATETNISLSWTTSTDNVSVVGYIVYLNGVSFDTVTEPTFTATGLDIFTEYTFEVEAFDASGNKSEKASITVSTTDETAPSVPADLAATATETSISLSWTASTDNVDVAGYVIYLDGDSVETVIEPAFTATELNALTEYTFEVLAFDTFGNKSEKALLMVSTTDETAPSVPADLVAVATDSSITLSWTASTDNVGVAGYVIYLDGALVDTVTEANFTIAGLEADTEFTFEVEAFDEAGNKSEKAIVVQRTIITGIESLELNELKVYPNPFSDYFIVEAENDGNAVIYDLSGKVMFNILLQTGNNRIDASVLPSGIYLLKQETNTMKMMKK